MDDQESDNQWVEIRGIIEVRTDGDDPNIHYDSLDMFDLQRECSEIPFNYCVKDYTTGEQNYFYCLVCSCDLRSLKSLEAHVGGKKHINRSMEKKRNDLGLAAPSINMPKLKERKKGKPDSSIIYLTLEERLKDVCEPVLGLEYITEYKCDDTSKHRVYTCALAGCSSAWGTSDDMFNHVKNPKNHLKNYLKRRFPEDLRIASMNNSEIMAKAMELEDKEGGAAARDYRVIIKERDQDKYWEINKRPLDWSESKAKLGVVKSEFKSGNPNQMPLGPKRSFGGGGGGLTSATVTSEQDLFPEFRVSEEMRSTKAKRLMGCMEVMLQIVKKRLEENEEKKMDKPAQRNLAKKIADLQTMSLSLEKRRLDELLPSYEEFKRTLELLIARMELTMDRSIWMVTQLQTEIVRLEIEAATSMDPVALDEAVDKLDQNFRELILTSPEIDRDERAELEKNIDNLRRLALTPDDRQFRKDDLLTGRESSGGGSSSQSRGSSRSGDSRRKDHEYPREREYEDRRSSEYEDRRSREYEDRREHGDRRRDDRASSSGSSVEELGVKPQVHKSAAVEDFKEDLTRHVSRFLRRPSGGDGARNYHCISDSKLNDMIANVVDNVTRVEMKAHEKSGRAWGSFYVNSKIKKAAEDYAKKKREKSESPHK